MPPEERGGALSEAVEPAAGYDGPRLAASGSVRVRVPAKINLHLGVGPRRPDGFHELTTVYQAISLYDELTADRADRLELVVEGEGADVLPTDENNLAVRAAVLLADHLGVPPRVRLHLRKQIPLAGGLAGGSADAAAALVACDALWDGGLDRNELATLAADLGSDVPFLVPGGTALGTGRGEVLSPVLAVGTWHWVVAVADGGLSTPTVYAKLDALRDAGTVPAEGVGAPDELLAALRQHDPRVLAAALANDMQAAALALRPTLARTLDAGLAEGALAALVSGSGPSCLFLAADADHAASVAARLTTHGVCRTVRTAHGPVPGARTTP
ncbi:4-(cytidine 5'-diphospho)-2-C-methyl-D-erythritol kinase [Actinocatenispora rupis]|uniref:4-diphosphocytidyl-2-C-methyl-D-erythritol kinase n=1 Tax=Actinocatenispora rupis TaxID=519421 RepID=A0A8J3J519_9ACTN|nr:4-diphosphocytidyl-2-C-methyl-D-erythritol kinase [Actinocatenispora rupis]